jgi:hypothetical protein
MSIKQASQSHEKRACKMSTGYDQGDDRTGAENCLPKKDHANGRFCLSVVVVHEWNVRVLAKQHSRELSLRFVEQ